MTGRVTGAGGRRSKWRYGIDYRLGRIPRYRTALLHSMARFGADFDRDAFIAACDSDDPDTINAITALEGDFGHIVNWLRQVAELGYHELVRVGKIDKSEERPLDALVTAKFLRATDRDRLDELVRLRNRLQHDYPGVAPSQLHEAVEILLEALTPLMARYGKLLQRLDEPSG